MKDRVSPEKGFYYHYKHRPEAGFRDYAYEVVGVGHHTENDGELFVVYRPLYESAMVYREGKMFDIRPLEMFMEDVTKEGKTFPRFKSITDTGLIKKLEEIRKEMYSVGA
jgi:hypothetical protein